MSIEKDILKRNRMNANRMPNRSRFFFTVDNVIQVIKGFKVFLSSAALFH